MRKINDWSHRGLPAWCAREKNQPATNKTMPRTSHLTSFAVLAAPKTETPTTTHVVRVGCRSSARKRVKMGRWRNWHLWRRPPPCSLQVEHVHSARLLREDLASTRCAQTSVRLHTVNTCRAFFHLKSVNERYEDNTSKQKYFSFPFTVSLLQHSRTLARGQEGYTAEKSCQKNCHNMAEQLHVAKVRQMGFQTAAATISAAAYETMARWQFSRLVTSRLVRYVQDIEEDAMEQRQGSKTNSAIEESGLPKSLKSNKYELRVRNNVLTGILWTTLQCSYCSSRSIQRQLRAASLNILISRTLWAWRKMKQNKIILHDEKATISTDI